MKNRKSQKIVFSTVGSEQHTLPLQMVSNLFEINCWRTYNLVNPLPVKDIIKLIDKHQIGNVGFSVTMEENLEELILIIEKLKERKPNLAIIVGGRAASKGKIPHARFFSNAKEAVVTMNKEVEA